MMVIVDHARIIYINEEKNCSQNDCKSRAVPPHARVSTFATAKINNSSNYMLLGIQKFLPVWKMYAESSTLYVNH